MTSPTAKTSNLSQSLAQMKRKWHIGMLTLACGSMGLMASGSYPLATPLPTVLFVLLTVFCYLWTNYWLVFLPAMLPVIGFATWSGWLTVEELDLIVLAVATAGYTRHLLGGSNQVRGYLGAPTVATLALFALSVLISLSRGFADAGGFHFGWFQGYFEPMNGVRLAKCFFEALLLLPLWQMVYQQNQMGARNLLSLGVMLGLAAAALAAVWERAAFTGLLNFSADYRTTGMFWEMHVGGAALDGFLALTVPFALRELMVARTTIRWGLAATVLALAGYASLTTFSRGVYLAVPIGALVFFGLNSCHGLPRDFRNDTVNWVTGVLLAAGFGVGAAWMFPSSGYRGVAALLGTVAMMLPLAHAVRGFKVSQWAVGLVTGLLLMMMMIALVWLTPKGVYIAWGVVAVFSAIMLWLNKRDASAYAFASPFALGGFLATLTGTALVAHHWGESAGLWHAQPVLLSVLGVCLSACLWPRPLWPVAMRWQSSTVGAMALVAAAVGVMGGGAYMSSRFSTGGQDMDTRLAHWQLGIDMLRSPGDWWLGKGLGRFPANHFLGGKPQQRPGDYRLKREGGDKFLTLTGGLHTLGDGELLRVMQRVSVPNRPVRVSAQVRAATSVSLRFEVCEKHLLYSDDCLLRDVTVEALPGKWQSINVELLGNQVSRGFWYAPQLIAFSAAMLSRGEKLDLGHLALLGPDGVNLLDNGDFSADMAHWFFTSDKNHLPWHIKNIFMNVLFDQGVLGLTLWVLLVGSAIVRLSAGAAKDHPLAPALTASLVGFVVVGLFDSLLDVPRLAMLFYLLVLVGLTLQVNVACESTRTSSAPRPRGIGGRPMRRRIKLLFLAVFGGLMLGAFGFFAAALGQSPSVVDRIAPAAWLRYAKSQLAENELVGAVLLPPLVWLQRTIERPPPDGPLPTLGKGQQSFSMPRVRYTTSGMPMPLVDITQSDSPVQASVNVHNANELIRSVANAQAGQVIEILPGRYRFNSSVFTRQAGTPIQPITLRATKPGDVLLEFDTVEGFRVTQPYWVIENLHIRGVCPSDEGCEHAFHITGAARGVVIRNNRVEDFNAHIKVNGQNGQWPDDGLVQFNTLTNQHPRKTTTPVTPFDLVAASGWQVVDNLVTDFANAGGNQIAYGIFMKGAGTNGRIERNLIICTSKDISQPGNRVGISWGGGGTNAASCRDKACAAEHTGGLAVNNIVAHCNDAGLDVNMSGYAVLAYNTLINTAGILIRGQSAGVSVYGNLLEGRIRSKDGVEVEESMNALGSLRSVLVEPDRLHLDRIRPVEPDTPLGVQIILDFCMQPRQAMTWKGAIGDWKQCAVTRNEQR